MSRCCFRRSGVQLLDILFNKIFNMPKSLLSEQGSLVLLMVASLFQCCTASKLPSTYKANVNSTEDTGLTLFTESVVNMSAADEKFNPSQESIQRQSPTPFSKTPFVPRRTVHYYSVPSTIGNTESHISKRSDASLQRHHITADPREVSRHRKQFPNSGAIKESQNMFTQEVPSVFDGYPDALYTRTEQRNRHKNNKTGIDFQNTPSKARQENHQSGSTIDYLGVRVGETNTYPKDKTLSARQTTAKTLMSVISEMKAEASGEKVGSDRLSAAGESTRQESRVMPEGYSGDIELDSYAGNILTKARPASAGSQEAPADATLGLLTSHPHGKPKKLIFCYYGTSANARPSVGKFWPENVDPFLCTHLIFAFADITKDGSGIKPNNWNDLGENGLYKRTLRLKEKNKDLKILLAVGGWKIGSKPFLPVIESADKWKTWISNTIDYLRRYGFDGLDMDWEFPGWRGSGPEDRHKFTLFMKDLHEAFAAEAGETGKPRLILTLATAASAFYVEKSYEPTEVHKYVDYMLLMTYNFHGSGWEKHTGHHTPLLPHSLDPEGEQRELYVLWAINYWLNFGVPRSKLVMGMASYGLGWKLTDSSQTGIRAPADGGNTKGKYTEESGILSHYEICEHVIQDGWNVEWIDEQKAPYAYGSGEWVGFDSPDSFYIKAVTVLQEGLAGAFIWSVEMDDFKGHCGGPKYPLIRTVYEVFTQHPLSANTSPSHSSQLRLSNAHSPINSVAATHSHGGGHMTPARGSAVHHGSVISGTASSSHQSSSDSQHSSGSIQNGDYHYEHNPDVDGHLSKPWQSMTDYDYEYYEWDDKSINHNQGTGEHHSPNAVASVQSHETPTQSTGSHLKAISHSPGSFRHNDYHYEHDPDVDGHLSKPWQAKSDYDYEYYHWDDESNHGTTGVHGAVSASAPSHSHNTPSHTTGLHLESIVHESSPPDTHHVSEPTHHDYVYEHNPDEDGHLSKPWQAKTDYNYEYYHWDDGSSHDATKAHVQVSAPASSHSQKSPSHSTGSHLERISHGSSSPGTHHDYTYEHNPDGDGHLSKPWQAKSDYDYEYYDWGGEHDHAGAVSSAASTHGHKSTTHEDHFSHGDYHDRHHHGDELEHVNCNNMGLGIHSSPDSCQHFVLCMPISAHDLGPSLMACPSGTLYDDSLKVCNHQHLVHCSR